MSILHPPGIGGGTTGTTGTEVGQGVGKGPPIMGATGGGGGSPPS